MIRVFFVQELVDLFFDSRQPPQTYPLTNVPSQYIQALRGAGVTD